MSERDRRTLKFGGYAVGAILLFMLVGAPVMDYWDNITAERATVEGKLRRIESSLNDRTALIQTRAGLQSLATIHESAATLNSQTARMLQQLESLPGYGRLAVRRLEGLPLRENEGYYRSGVSLQFTGQLSDLQQFLQAVEKAQPRLKIDRLTVTAAQRDPSRVEGQMVLVGYAVVMQEGESG